MSSSLVDRVMSLFRPGRPAQSGDGVIASRTLPYEEARELARHSDVKVRQAVAAHKDTPEEILYFMAGDQDAGVRRAVALNPHTPSRADFRLASDIDPDVRSDLAAKIATLAPGMTATEQDKVRRFVYMSLQALARDQVSAIRKIISETLKGVPDAPVDIVRALARDVDLEVCNPVLEFSPVLTDDDLLEIIRMTENASSLSAISRRSKVSAPVSDAIVSTNSTQAITDLLGNPCAQIREETLDRLIERSALIPEWQDPLVHRPVLSNQSAQRLASFVAHHLLEDLQSRSDMSESLRKTIADTVRRRLRQDAPAEEKAPAGEGAAWDMVVNMEKAGTLSENVLLQALNAGDREFVLNALGVRSGQAMALVRKIVDLRSAKGMVSLVWMSGFSIGAAVQIQSRLLKLAGADILGPPRGAQGYPMSSDEMTWQISYFQSMLE